MQLKPLSQSLHKSANELLQKKESVTLWFKNKINPKPFYASMDIRQSCYKVASCDTNLYPAGWNHVHPNNFDNIEAQLKQAIPKASHLLLIPEAHTTNMGYFENLDALIQRVEAAGHRITIGSTIPYLQQKTSIHLPSARQMDLYPLKQLDAQQFDGTIINHDRIHLALENGDDLPTPFYPSPQLGWDKRRKSDHFALYQTIVNEFCHAFDQDPRLFSMHFDTMEHMHFDNPDCIEALKEKTATLLDKINHDYQHQGIQEDPFVMIKANSGTYGNAVLAVHHVSELDQLNKKTKLSMSRVKGSIPTHDLMLQEGIPSAGVITTTQQNLLFILVMVKL